MADKTSIEWTDSTWNFLRGCSRVSAGCERCYAETIARRFSGEGLPYAGTISDRGKWNGNITFHEDILLKPLRWKRPRKIFVNSMSDLFHEKVTDEMLDKAFAVMALTPHHTYQILTKRPELMSEYFGGPDRWSEILRLATTMGKLSGSIAARFALNGYDHLANVWLGVSVEDQKTADERIPHLLSTPAAVRFLSMEPLLGQVDLRNVEVPKEHDQLRRPWDLDGYKFDALSSHNEDRFHQPPSRLDWVIVGGESGSNARPMHPDWVRSIRDQCNAAGVPFFFKQNGEFIADRLGDPNNTIDLDGCRMSRVGKKQAGRILDGRTWDEFPETK